MVHSPVQLIGGPAHKCFESSKTFVTENPDHQLCVGYALSKKYDRWIYHVWVLSPNGFTILEMTELLRTLYFGVVLKEDEW